MSDRPDEERTVAPTERDVDEGPHADEGERPTDDQVVGLGVDDAEREVPEPNEPA